METKKERAIKLHRPVNVVGGTSSDPPLREVIHHRNEPSPSRRLQMQHQSRPMITNDPSNDKRRSSSEMAKSCEFCRNAQTFWNDNERLGRRKQLTDVLVRASNGDTFYCNRFVLIAWSESLEKRGRNLRMTDGGECNVIDMDRVDSEILRSALRFMYGGTITQIPPQHLEGIVRMADDYSIPHLKRACFDAADWLRPKASTASSLWMFAEAFGRSNVATRAMRFIYANLEKVMNESDWKETMADRRDMLLKLFEASAGWTEINKDWRSWKKEDNDDEPRSSFANSVRSVWKESEGLTRHHAYSDVVIVTKSGDQFHAHSQIIHASSPAFAQFLDEEIGASESNVVYMDDMDEDVVLEFLRYFYRQDPSDDFPQLATFVLVLATTYHVDELASLCEREISAQQITSIETALDMLREAEEHRMDSAKTACFRYLYDEAAALRENKGWLKLIHDEPQLLVEMMLKSKRFRRMRKK